MDDDFDKHYDEDFDNDSDQTHNILIGVFVSFCVLVCICCVVVAYRIYRRNRAYYDHALLQQQQCNFFFYVWNVSK